MSKELMTKEKDDWIQKKWRPMMAIMYMVVCVFDFILFPIMFTVVQFWEFEASNDAFRQWQPLTLIGAGLFHMAMGAVLGITAWSRGQEKIAGCATPPSPTTPPALPAPNMTPVPSSVSYSTGSNRMPAAAPTGQVMTGYGGKPAPVLPPDPEI
jgi:hypothetical protein